MDEKKKEKRFRRPKHTLEQIKKQFAKNGDELLSKVYVGSKQRLAYVCHGCKGQRETCWNNYSRGIRCKKCAIEAHASKASPRRLTRLALRDKLYNMTELCRMLGLHYADFRTLTLDGLLPRGTQKVGSKIYYTEADVGKIKEMIEVV